jgi:hypothetical protein
MRPIIRAMKKNTTASRNIGMPWNDTTPAPSTMLNGSMPWVKLRIISIMPSRIVNRKRRLICPNSGIFRLSPVKFGINPIRTV